MAFWDSIFGKNKKSTTETPSEELRDIAFVSNQHVRTTDGVETGRTDDACYRGVKVDANGDGTYTVGIYLQEGEHPVWGDNMTMAPKRMRITKRSKGVTVLRGISGSSIFDDFSDYGITIYKSLGEVDKIVLHMHDRDTYISYLSNRPKKEQVGKKEIDEEYTNLFLSTQHMINDAEDVNDLHIVLKGAIVLKSPFLFAKLGEKYMDFSESDTAKVCWINGMASATGEADYVSDPLLSLGIGMCISNYFTHFTGYDVIVAFDVTKVGYFLLSIAIGVHQLSDGYAYRAQLFTGHELPITIQSFVTNKGAFGSRREPYFISDYYNAATKGESVNEAMLSHAGRIHNWLEDTTFEGKDADDYTLQEFVALGERRHLSLFDTLREEDKSEKYTISGEERTVLMGNR
jgi:hypothetical protein